MCAKAFDHLMVFLRSKEEIDADVRLVEGEEVRLDAVVLFGIKQV